jgi:uncharacterized protein involved in outer membrane biogenesis
MASPVEGVQASPATVAPAQKHRVRWIVTALVLLFVLNGLLLPFINLRSYYRTITDSLSRSLGHTVHLGSVNLTLFPLPSLVIHDLTVEEDPSFGAEPLLRAPSVTVFLRISSLWRQRLEVSRIDLDNASVNLTRDPSGRWNFSSLLLQASRTATSPTAQRHPGPIPRFPYIEFSGARINFVEDHEKKSLSFLNADASVWLADPNQWRIRLEAQPARTDLDLDLEDAGTVRLDGSLTRADSLDQLPLDLHAEWTGAQLGQVSRLMLGSDSGWRGDLRAETDITGNMNNLVLRSRLRVADAHRLEFTPLQQLDIDARCQASYHHSLQSLDNLTCLWPTGDGHLLLTGAVPNLSHPQPDLNLEINHTPVDFVLSLLGLLRSNLPTTLNATGTINGQFTWAPQKAASKSGTQPNAAPRNILTGHAVADTVVIHLAGMDQPITFAALRFTTPVAPTAMLNTHTHHRKPSPTPANPPVSPNTVLLEPATFKSGAPTPMQLSGQFTRSGFSLHFTGETALARLAPLTRNIAQLYAFADLASKGTAQTDFTFAGPWIPPINPDTGASLPVPIEGSARLQHVELKPAWLPEPIEIASATAGLADGNIAWTNATISVNGIAAKGSATYPVTCDNPVGCPAEINLDFPTLDAAALQSALLGTDRHGELVQAILSTVESPAPPWPTLKGNIHAATLTLGTLKLTNARATIAVSNNNLKIVSLDAATLGGSTHIAGSIEPASDGPKYTLNLTCSGIKLLEVADLFHETWGPGSIDGQANLNLHGYSGLAASATGDFHWSIRGNWGGTWTEPPPRWTAAGTISNQTLVLTKGPAQGTIGFDRKLDLDWTRASKEDGTPVPALDPENKRPIHITGTLAQPFVDAPSHVLRATAP